MRGHEPLIVMRRRGFKPPIIFMGDSNMNHRWDRDQVTPEIDISEDNPYLVDLRFLVGLVVCIHCVSKKRARAFYEQAKRAKPILLTSSYSDKTKCLYQFWTPECEVIEEDGYVQLDTRRH